MTFQFLGKLSLVHSLNNVLIFGSGAMSPDMVPMLIQTGSRAICVQFDVWGVTRLFADSLKKGWDYAKEFEGNPRPNGLSNGYTKPE